MNISEPWPPKGQEGLFLGYANLPLAIGTIVGAPAEAFVFNEIMWLYNRWLIKSL